MEFVSSDQAVNFTCGLQLFRNQQGWNKDILLSIEESYRKWRCFCIICTFIR